jgi:hypothetical protein
MIHSIKCIIILNFLLVWQLRADDFNLNSNQVEKIIQLTHIQKTDEYILVGKTQDFLSCQTSIFNSLKGKIKLIDSNLNLIFLAEVESIGDSYKLKKYLDNVNIYEDLDLKLTELTKSPYLLLHKRNNKISVLKFDDINNFMKNYFESYLKYSINITKFNKITYNDSIHISNLIPLEYPYFIEYVNKEILFLDQSNNLNLYYSFNEVFPALDNRTKVEKKEKVDELSHAYPELVSSIEYNNGVCDLLFGSLILDIKENMIENKPGIQEVNFIQKNYKIKLLPSDIYIQSIRIKSQIYVLRNIQLISRYKINSFDNNIIISKLVSDTLVPLIFKSELDKDKTFKRFVNIDVMAYNDSTLLLFDNLNKCIIKYKVDEIKDNKYSIINIEGVIKYSLSNLNQKIFVDNNILYLIYSDNIKIFVQKYDLIKNKFVDEKIYNLPSQLCLSNISEAHIYKENTILKILLKTNNSGYFVCPM